MSACGRSVAAAAASGWPASVRHSASSGRATSTTTVEPEVVVDLWTGGARCSAVYRWQGGRYRRTVLDFGNAGYDLVDLDRDAVPELRSSDDQVLVRLAPYAYSPRPIRIWHWQAGRLANVKPPVPQRRPGGRASALQGVRARPQTA